MTIKPCPNCGAVRRLLNGPYKGTTGLRCLCGHRFDPPPTRTVSEAIAANMAPRVAAARAKAGS